MEVRLLGPVEVWAAGRAVDPGSPRQRCVLAALAVDAGRPVSTAKVIDRCARLPLALAVVCARATVHPDFGLAAVAEELRAAQGGLAAFDGGDPASDVRTVFSCSYRTLGPDAARVFRLLGLHPGPDISAPAAASLAGSPLPQVKAVLAELTRAHLLAERTSGRYTLHDLLRAYATELAHAVDGDTDRRAATHRLLDHYVHTGYTAALLLRPTRNTIALPTAATGVTAEHLADTNAALAWYTVEYPVYLRAIDHAVTAGFDAHAWQLAWTLTHYFERRGHWHDWVLAHSAGLEAARRGQDRVGQAHMHHELARVHARSARYDDALRHLRPAGDLFALLDDEVGQAQVQDGYSFVYGRQGRRRESLRHALRALDLYRAAGHRQGEAGALNNVGWTYAHLGDHRQAIAHCERAVELQRAIGHFGGEANTWDSLGFSHHQLGHHDQAVACYRRALDLHREADDRYQAAWCWQRLGDVHQDAGDRQAARDAWKEALHILDQLRHPDAEDVRKKLAGPAAGG